MSPPSPDAPQRPKRRGIVLLPNLFTTGCLACGFFGIISAINGDFGRACAAIYFAMLFDGLDGRVARWTGTESAFGKEYDSLADMVAFGVAPALIAYPWGIERIAEYGDAWARFGWVAAFLYAVCAALRLARFNARAATADKRYFEGLPSPSAAGLVAAYVWFTSEWREPGLVGLVVLFCVPVIAGALMVSRFPYSSTKQIDWNARVKFFYFVIVPLSLALVVADPPPMLLFLFTMYALSAPTVWLLRRLRRSATATPPSPGDHV
ncbi:MAG: CDP-diacylglycerol--serine O-phosphatidyltransferase [Gammaproteobacteria bacterium]